MSYPASSGFNNVFNLSFNGVVLTLCMGQHENAHFDPRFIWRTVQCKTLDYKRKLHTAY